MKYKLTERKNPQNSLFGVESFAASNIKSELCLAIIKGNHKNAVGRMIFCAGDSKFALN
jgi:hypothetical protein